MVRKGRFELIDHVDNTIKSFRPKRSPFRKARGMVVNVERRRICDQIACILEDTDYAILPPLPTRKDDLRKF